MKQKEKKTTAIAQKKDIAFHPFFYPLFIFLFTFLLYSNTLHHDFVMDDGAVITNHETVQKGFAGIRELFGQSSVYGSTKENFGTYRPFTMSLFAIEKQFFGNSPAAFHWIQVLLYAILCVAIYFVLKEIFGNIYPLFPVIASLLFAAHPIHTEVAANIKSADEILSLLFCMLALFYSVRYIERSKLKFAIVSFALFISGLFSKESSATFVFIIPLALYFFRTANRKQLLLIFALHLFALAIYFFARNMALDKSPETIPLINNALAGAHSPGERYATIFTILFRYLQLLCFPHPLCWDYGYNQIPLVGFENPLAIFSLLIYLALGTISFIGIFKPGIFKFSNPQIVKLISFCILFFLISISVSSNIFILIGATMAERFLFTPSLAFCILLAFTLLKLTKFESGNLRQISTVRFLPIYIILALYSIKTFSRNKDWKSNLTLFASGVEDGPNSYRTNTTFAWESLLAGEKESDPNKKKFHFQNAVSYYKRGLAIYDKADADWYNYGVSNSNLGNPNESVTDYLHAIQLNPKHRNSLYNLATIYFERKDYQNALIYFSRIYEDAPDFIDVAFKIGIIHHLAGKPQQAIPYYERYYKNNPNNKDVLNNLSMAYNCAGEK
ncbi:MAG TPA: tetratricopeptide repeat protein, partial [Bacteroidia bacterium]